MTDTTTAQPGSGAEALPAAPRNDAEAAALDAAKAPPAEPAKDPPTPPVDDKKKPNRTREYIDRIQGDNAGLRNENSELKKRLDALEKRFPSSEPKPPNPSDFYQDPQAYTDAITRHQVSEARKQWEKDQQQQAAAREQHEQMAAYTARAMTFAETHPDFQEVVGSIDPRLLPNELQAAIMAHENGAAIAYHLANNDDELWQLATMRPELMPLAVARVSSRLKATQEVGAAPPPSIPAPAPIPAPPAPKPVSNAPAPPPTVGGRAPADTPQEKLTDEQWYAQERERRRKR